VSSSDSAARYLVELSSSCVLNDSRVEREREPGRAARDDARELLDELQDAPHLRAPKDREALLAGGMRQNRCSRIGSATGANQPVSAGLSGAPP
jgi:hypothetical protein